MSFTGQYQSMKGRQVGWSSTGGIVSKHTGTGAPSTAIAMGAQMWGPGVYTTASSSGASLVNYGVNQLSSATSTAATYTMLRPEKGVATDIISMASATALTIDATSTAVLFFGPNSTVAGATSITINSSLGAIGQAVRLIGESTAKWFLSARSTNVAVA